MNWAPVAALITGTRRVYNLALNFVFVQLVAKRYDHDWDKMKVLSIVEEEGGKRINMAHLVSFNMSCMLSLRSLLF